MTSGKVLIIEVLENKRRANKEIKAEEQQSEEKKLKLIIKWVQ